MSGLTHRGWAFIALGGGAVIAAVLAGQPDTLRIGILLLLIPLLSLLVALRSRVRLTAFRTIEPPRVPVGERTTVHLAISNRARIPTGVLLVEDSIPFTLGARPRFVLDHVWARLHSDVAYDLDPVIRGRYSVGPLTVRITDPFGMVELKRAFSDTGTLIVTPTVHQLPSVRLAGEWGGSGDSRPRAITSAGEEDATIRAYRTGDDMRRVHWRATAHHGELMVRREEQPWQSRATLLLDNRLAGHAGEGTDSSLEWGVTALASIGTHLSSRGYAIQLATGTASATAFPASPETRTSADTSPASPETGASATAFPASPETPTSAGTAQTLLLDTLAVVTARRDASVAQWPGLLSGSETSTGLLIAVIGRLSAHEARVAADLRHGSTAAMAVLLDVASWTSLAGSENEQARLAETGRILRDAGWSVVVARRGDRIAALWEHIGPDASAERDIPQGAA